MDKFRVLVVDDSLDMQWILTATLEKAGIDTSLACNGIEALETLDTSEPPDAIVTDIDMPGMNGLQLISKLAADARLSAIPVIVASAHHNVSSPTVFGCLLKPFDAMTFVAMVSKACSAGRALKQQTGVEHDRGGDAAPDSSGEAHGESE